jgi:DNA-binding CsgD family transcriptional regulator
MRELERANLPQLQRVNEEDWVALVQALTYGKGLKKALLIALRMRAEFAGQTGTDLNLEAIACYDELNEREKEVVAHIASGMTSSEIAELLRVSTKYTYNIRSRIRFKLGVPDDEDLLVWLRDASLERPAGN